MKKEKGNELEFWVEFLAKLARLRASVPNILLRGAVPRKLGDMKTKQHQKKESGWTNQESRCEYAGWWDCSFFCNKLSTEGNIVACNYNVPDFEKCEVNK